MTAIDSLKASFCSICYLLFFFANLSALTADPQTKSTIDKPRVSVITSVYKGDQFIEGFLEDMTKQTIFNESELILINANSPGNEEPIIKKYQAQYPNIIYERLDYDPGVYGVWNLGIKKARADFITNANLDDRRNPENLASQAQALEDERYVFLNKCIRDCAPCSWVLP